MISRVPTQAELEDTVLDGDCTADDLIEILNHLPFAIGGNGRPAKRICQISLDRHARDYLVAAVRARYGNK